MLVLHDLRRPTVKRTILHCQIDSAFMERVKRQAAAEQRTITAVVIRALERYLDEAKAKHEAA